MDHVIRHTKRVVIGILGAIVVLIGIILIPYPGPGWLVVFAGLALLSTEFQFARRWLDSLRGQYDKWSTALRQQHGAVRIGALLFTGMVVVVTVWLVNGFGITASVLQLNLDWLTSPFLR